MKSAIRFTGASSGSIPALAALAAALLLSGCGDFWQNPYGTGGGGSTATTTSLTASPTTVAVGASVTLTATVTPSAATGSVTFYNGSTSIGSADLSSGTATSSTSFTSAGSESLTATYSGDSTYASSTSSAVTVTVTAAAASRQGLGDSAAKIPSRIGTANAVTGLTLTTSAYAAAPIRATRAFGATGGTLTAKNAEAVVVEGHGTVTLTDTEVNAAEGKGRGVLLYRDSRNAGANPSFNMTGGSLRYDCDAASKPSCAEAAQSKEVSRPATLFAVANATAAITLTDVEVTNRTSSDAHRNGTILTAAALPVWGEPGRNGGHATLRLRGTALKGDAIVDSASTAQIEILDDVSGSGSSLTGAINAADSGQAVSLELDRASVWIVTGTSHLTSLEGLELDVRTVNNIDGGGHCVYYSGTVNGSASKAVFDLSGGGYLAPTGTAGLGCE